MVPALGASRAGRIAAAAVLAGLGLFHAVSLTRGAPLQDFGAYLRGAWGVVHHGDPYDPRNPGALLPFIYPPFAAMVLAPLSLLPRRGAELVMTVSSLGCLWYLVDLVTRRAWPRAGWSRSWGVAAATLVALATEPVWATLGLGQINLVLAALVATDLLRLRDTRWAGVLIGVAAGIKITPAFFVLHLLAAGRPRDAARAAATAVATVLVAGAVMPRPSWRYWAGGDFLFSLSEVGKAANQSLSGAWVRLADDESVTRWPWLVVALGVATVGLASSGRLDRDGRAADALVVAAVTQLLVAPTSWTHYWVWTVPAAVVLAARFRERPVPAAALAVVAVVPVLVGRWWFPPYPEVLLDHRALWRTLLDELYVLPACVGLAAVAVRVRRRGARMGPDRAHGEADQEVSA